MFKGFKALKLQGREEREEFNSEKIETIVDLTASVAMTPGRQHKCCDCNLHAL